MNALDQALSIINSRRLKSELLAKQNMTLAMQNKEFAQEYEKYMDDVINQAKSGKLQKNLEKTREKLDFLLKKLKIGSITPVYACKKCQDTGYVDGQKCTCLNKELNKILAEKSGFEKLVDFKDATFEGFERPEEMRKIYDKMRQQCHSDFKKKVIFLSGGTGTGKTYLMTCMANELINRGKYVLLTTAFKMAQDILRSHACRDFSDKDEILSTYLNCDVLFIDDLGVETTLDPAITNQYFYAVLNERKMRMLSTVITTNLSPADIKDVYDERVYSRIADDNTIKIQFDGKDMRLK